MSLIKKFIVGIALFAIVFLVQNNLSVVDSGITALSVSNINIASSNPNLDGQLIVINAVLDKTNRQLTYTGSVGNSNDVTLSGILVNPVCSYDLNETGIITIGEYRITGKDMNGNNVYSFQNPYYKSVMTISSVAKLVYSVTINTQNQNGLQATVTLDPNTKQGYIKDSQENIRGFVELKGGLLGYQACPQPSIDSIVTRDVGSIDVNSYMLVDKYAVIQLLSPSWNTISPQQYPYFSTPATTPKATQTSCKFLIDSQSQRLQCTPSDDVIEPIVNIYLKTDYVGQKIPTSSYSFLNVQNQRFIARQPQNLQYTLKNIGTQASAADVNLKCDTSISFNSKRETLGPGQQINDFIQVQGEAGTYSCTLSAADVNDPNAITTIPLTFTIFKPECPSLFECCSNQVDYNDKACKIVNYEAFDSTTNSSIAHTDEGTCISNKCQYQYSTLASPTTQINVTSIYSPVSNDVNPTQASINTKGLQTVSTSKNYKITLPLIIGIIGALIA